MPSTDVAYVLWMTGPEPVRPLGSPSRVLPGTLIYVLLVPCTSFLRTRAMWLCWEPTLTFCTYLHLPATYLVLPRPTCFFLPAAVDRLVTFWSVQEQWRALDPTGKGKISVWKLRDLLEVSFRPIHLKPRSASFHRGHSALCDPRLFYVRDDRHGHVR